jgi:hypothetical protein
MGGTGEGLASQTSSKNVFLMENLVILLVKRKGEMETNYFYLFQTTYWFNSLNMKIISKENYF